MSLLQKLIKKRDMPRKKRKIRINQFAGLTRKDMELLEVASRREPSKFKKQRLDIFTCKKCGQQHYYKVIHCIQCGSIELTETHHATTF